MRGSYLPLIVGILFFIGVILGQIPLLLVAFLLLLVWGTTHLWERYALSRVEYHRRLSTKRAFFGEEMLLELELANRKLLPLPWVKIDDELPDSVTLLKGKTTKIAEGRVTLTNMFPLNLYHRIKRRFPILCPRRGCYLFGPTRIRAGDPFGFFHKDMFINSY